MNKGHIREIVERLYLGMSITARKKFHEEFGGDCLTDIYKFLGVFE